MSKLILSSLAGAVLTISVPSFAASPDGIAANGATFDQVQARPRAEQRYCVLYETAGSRIRHKQCKTRKDWLAEGFDPLEK